MGYKKRLLASIELANRTIDYKPRISFDEALKYNIEWFKINWELLTKYSDFPPGMNSALRKNIN